MYEIGQEIMPVFGNVTSNLIGYWFGLKKTTDLYW